MLLAMERLSLFLASGFGVGYLLPMGQGTLAAFLFLFLVPSFLGLSFFYQFFLVLGLGILGVFVSSVAEKELGKKDDHRIVIDEILSIFVTFAGMPMGISWSVLFTGFCLNRIADWLKPIGISKIQILKRGWGIMLDDFASAILVNLVLRLIFWFY